jgi:hypothetical protein
MTRYAREGIDMSRVISLEMPQFATTLRIPPHLSDPFLYRHLWSNGLLDPGPMVASLARGYYDVVVTSKAFGRGPPEIRTELRRLVEAGYRPLFVDSFGLVHHVRREAAADPP